jgi:NADH-quinone oxidoreductase subunit N
LIGASPSVLPALAAAPDVAALLRATAPELVLSVGVLLIVLLEAFLGPRPRLYPRLALGFVCAALAFAVYGLTNVVVPSMDPRESTVVKAPVDAIVGGPLVVDRMANLFRTYFLAAGGLTLAFGMRRQAAWFGQGEFHALLLGSLAGMSVLSAATDMLTAYLAFETVSITGYLMVGYVRGDRRSAEAGLKYVMFGAVASGAMLYGLTLLFGLAGGTSMEAVAGAIRDQGASPAALFAAVLVFAGFAFKVSAAPFHFWAPDAYQGAPSIVAGFLGTASKAAGFAVAIRILGTFGGPARAPDAHSWFPFLPEAPLTHWLLGIGAVLTLIVGNTAALKQSDLKRLLAWSSVGQAGYLLMALAVATPAAFGAVLFYFWIYMLMTLGGFGIVGLLHPMLGGTELKHYRGLGKRAPVLAVALTALMISLAGLPPTVGFWGKVMLFKPVIEGRFYGLAVVGLLASATSLYYYAALIRSMFLQPPEEGAGPLELERPDWVLVLLCTVPLAVGGLFGWWLVAQGLTDASAVWAGNVLR